MLNYLLARADGSDATESNMRLVLLIAASIVGVGVLVRVVMLLARRNAQRQAPQVDAAAIVWGAVTLGSAIFTTVQQWTWEKQHLQDMLSGYADPHELGPAYPWNLWGAMWVAYVGLVAWALWKKR